MGSLYNNPISGGLLANPAYSINETLVNPLYKKQKKTKWYQSSLTEIPGKIVTIISKTVAFIKSIFAEIDKKYSIPKTITLISKGVSNNFDLAVELFKKFAVVSLVAVPVHLYNLIKKVVELGETIYIQVNKNKDLLIIANAAATVLAALGKVFELPAIIANTIALFIPLKGMSWIPPLAAISAILSVGNFLSYCFNGLEAHRFANELKHASNKALLQRLRNIRGNQHLRYALKNADRDLLTRIDEELKRIEDGQIGSLSKIIEEINQCNLDPSLMKELQKAGNLAYADCIKSKDAKFRSKHFEVKEELIQSALENIHHQPAEKTNEIRRALEGRLQYGKFSAVLSSIIDAINIAATVLIVISSFILTATLLKPIALALMIGIGIACVIKAIDKYQKTKDFESKLL